MTAVVLFAGNHSGNHFCNAFSVNKDLPQKYLWQRVLFTEAFWRASVNNAPLYRALYAGLLFFIFDLRYASPLINAPEVILASSLIPQGEPVRKVPLRLLLPLPEYRRRPIALWSADFSDSLPCLLIREQQTKRHVSAISTKRSEWRDLSTTRR